MRKENSGDLNEKLSFIDKTVTPYKQRETHENGKRKEVGNKTKSKRKKLEEEKNKLHAQAQEQEEVNSQCQERPIAESSSQFMNDLANPYYPNYIPMARIPSATLRNENLESSAGKAETNQLPVQSTPQARSEICSKKE